MKFFFILFLSGLCFSLTEQDNNYLSPDQIQKIMKNKNGKISHGIDITNLLKKNADQFYKNDKTINNSKPPYPIATLSHGLANGSKVYLLLQDNMPCFVPQKAMAGIMPGAKGFDPSKYMSLNIPNASPIIPLIPEDNR